MEKINKTFLKKIVSKGKELYQTKPENYQEVLKSKSFGFMPNSPNFTNKFNSRQLNSYPAYGSNVSGNFQGGFPQSNFSQEGISQLPQQNIQAPPQVTNISEVTKNNLNSNIPPAQMPMTPPLNTSKQQMQPQYQQQMAGAYGLPNLNSANGAPINIIAKNYINPNSISDSEYENEEKDVEAKSVKMAQIPDALLRKSSTDWEPINYSGVDEKYDLYELSRVEIKYDNEEQKILYKLIEPVLEKEEEAVLAELKTAFIYVFEKFTPEFTKLTGKELIIKGAREIMERYKIILTDSQFEKITYFLVRDFLGLEMLEPIMRDPFIEDISCDGLNVPIFVNHLKYGPLEVNRRFINGDKLNSFIVKLAQKSKQEVSLSKPILQGALTDGSRIEAIYGKEISEKGSSFTIRKFRETPFTPIHLIEFGTMDPFLLAYLWLAVENKQSLLVSGGTATGKTTILNALSLFAPPTSKIVSIEDTPEINLPHEHWLPMISREMDGKAEVTMFDLLKASLRERPDYIIVGEIRGAEAAILFQGMATGHAGLGTVHAEKFSDLVNRMTISPINLPKQLLTELKIVIFQKQYKIKKNMVRRTSSVIEIMDYDNKKDEFHTNEVLKFNPQEDVFSFSNKSLVIEQLLKLRGGKEEDLWNEIEKRRRILDSMHKNKILEFKQVSNIIKSYYKNPAGIQDYIAQYVGKDGDN